MKQKQNNYEELQTLRSIGKLPAIGSSFCNGMSNRYDNQPPFLLKEILDPKELKKFSSYMDQLNYKTAQYWPCLFAYYCGYICAPFTIGLSLCLPNICVSEAEKVLRNEIKKINHDILSNKKLQMRLIKHCCDSYLLIQEVDFAQFTGNQLNL